MATFKKVLFFIMGLVLTALYAQALPTDVRVLNAVYPSTSEDNRCMLIDRQGVIWIGSDFGLKSYDGYRFTSYRSDANTPNILPNNLVLSLAEGTDDCLWIGTQEGLVKMDKRKGVFHLINMPSGQDKMVYSLCTTHDGTLWMGNNNGVSRYDETKRTFYTYNSKNTIVIDKTGHRSPLGNISVKSFAEDKDGQIYIGTWEQDLYRLDPKKNILYRYNLWKPEEKISAYSLRLDQKGQLWIGTWGNGLKCLRSPRNIQNPDYVNVSNSTTLFSLIYKLAEDVSTHTIWGCSREGITVASEDNPQAGMSTYKEIGIYTPYKPQSVYDICSDGLGNIWAMSRFNGLYHISTIPSPFHIDNFLKGQDNLIGIHSIFTQDGNLFAMSLLPVGFAIYEKRNQNMAINDQIPIFSSLDYDKKNTHISDITENPNGDIWLASNGYGLISLNKGGGTQIYDRSNSQLIRDNYVNTFFRTRQGVQMIGENRSIDYILPSGKMYNLSLPTNAKGICDDHQGNIWVATSSMGIVKIKGDLANPKSLSLTWYNKDNGKFPINDAISCLEDSKHRLWVISNSGGLFLYDTEKDAFKDVSDQLHWDVDRIFSMLEDNAGTLWLTTDHALINIEVDDRGEMHYTTYTTEDGLGDIRFIANSCYKYGNELYFGSGKDLISFTPSEVKAYKNRKRKSNLIITDVIIDGKRYAELDSVFREKLSDATPNYMRAITLPSSINKFSIEFALLTYLNTQQCKYAYYLEGYDNQWHYVDASLRQATFENMPSGTYKLHVKAADSYGQWNEMPYTLKIKVLPPWYASWWAFLIYLGLIGLGIRFSIRWYRERLRTKNRLQMAVIFTNITHELLTPLTVISAAADSIQRTMSGAESQTSIIHENINRLTRMLRQILEVRKSQAGKLQLKVSEGKLGNFCEETYRSLMPMFNQKELHFEANITCMDEKAWFDTDKVEKMLYNLLNNAVKYTAPGGRVTLQVSIQDELATLVVSDNGIGISKDKMKHLYHRFLDGDYRQMNTIGTGIGLSLVNDLVKLHHGKIHCDSEEGKGTTFTITFPVNRSSYSEEEILKRGNTKPTDAMFISSASKGEEAMATSQSNNPISSLTKNVDNNDELSSKEYTVLLVEDNQELLLLMSSLLSTHYNVLTATNGEKAQKIIQKSSLDVVVTDVMMPVMDGIELTQWIKTSENFSQLPVIMLTAKTQEGDRTEGYRAGADAYITKPFSLEVLQLRIDNIIANRQRIRQKFQQQTEFHTEELHYSNPDELFLQSCIDKIKEHLTDTEYSREALAAELCISSSTLYNKLRTLTGMNVTGFINSIRMKEACRILRSEPTIRVNELAYRVGYGTPRYFSLCFKKEYGMSIKEFVSQSGTSLSPSDSCHSDEG